MFSLYIMYQVQVCHLLVVLNIKSNALKILGSSSGIWMNFHEAIDRDFFLSSLNYCRANYNDTN